MKMKVAPSILSADFGKMAEAVENVKAWNADWVHCDVMDGVYVPNITFGMPMIKALRKYSDMVLDVHLMIIDPIRYVDDFVKAGADNITIHHEACKNQIETLQYIKSKGVKAAVSIKPKTDPKVLETYIPYVDMILIMSVEPGFGGQSFIPSAIDSTRTAYELVKASGRDIDIEVDGGLSAKNVDLVTSVGANVIVAGSAVFGAPDMKAAVSDIRANGEKAYCTKI